MAQTLYNTHTHTHTRTPAHLELRLRLLPGVAAPPFPRLPTDSGLDSAAEAIKPPFAPPPPLPNPPPPPTPRGRGGRSRGFALRACSACSACSPDAAAAAAAASFACGAAAASSVAPTVCESEAVFAPQGSPVVAAPLRPVAASHAPECGQDWSSRSVSRPPKLRLRRPSSCACARKPARITHRRSLARQLRCSLQEMVRTPPLLGAERAAARRPLRCSHLSPLRSLRGTRPETGRAPLRCERGSAEVSARPRCAHVRVRADECRSPDIPPVETSSPASCSSPVAAGSATNVTSCSFRLPVQLPVRCRTTTVRSSTPAFMARAAIARGRGRARSAQHGPPKDAALSSWLP